MIKKLIKKIVFGHKSDQESLVKFLKNKGAVIGDDLNIFDIRNTHIDELNPHLIHIGNHVNIVASTILTHDYSWSVIKGKYGEIIGNQRPVIIGNNVFIGDGSIILGGTVIEDNVIVGARSVVSGTLSSDTVYAGNPAKPIMSLDEYRKKRTERQLGEAKMFVKLYKSAFGTNPPKDKLHEYFFIFENNEQDLSDIMKHRLTQCGTYELSKQVFESHTPLYSSFQSFLDDSEI